MYHEPTNVPAKARTSNLNEELGQIGFIFSDKTGTLTRNEMKWLRCTVGTVVYGPGQRQKAGLGRTDVTRPPMAKGIPLINPEYRFDDPRLLLELMRTPEDSARYRELNEYLTALAVCHTVVPGYEGCAEDHVHALSDPPCGAKLSYQAASPDELALVEAATDEQYHFHSRVPVTLSIRGRSLSGNRCTVNILGRHCEFDVVEILGFTSDRKRMSVIVYDHRDSQSNTTPTPAATIGVAHSSLCCEWVCARVCRVRVLV
jgi:magnesium-transporting ATPase (P-type)